MASDQKTLVFDDVAKHNKADDCWLIISGKVYDVTPFIDDHPGGGEVWLRATGKDATVDFGDVGHSDIAKGKMKKYCIGEIDQSTIPVKNSNNTSELIGKNDSFIFQDLLVFDIGFLILLEISFFVSQVSLNNTTQHFSWKSVATKILVQELELGSSVGEDLCQA
ncbi:hypothetical protein L1987_76119 [Smallanthus sonchifolius]|uniref:Uncharacterized protein n=1 Tax=Smallanthus sonchifolius TaxID=185202 RepID=A0ACB9A8D7_9ASTR|nr:hypothetical protein L1987_76119 [Smallanthus sonchifolius]